MSAEKVMDAVKRLPAGFHVHSLHNFVNGQVSTTKRGTVKLTIEIGIAQLGSPFDDLRAVMAPSRNQLVPLLLFVEPDVVLAALPAGAEEPVAPNDEEVAEAWVTACDSDGVKYDGQSFERGYRIGAASDTALPEGEEQPVGYVDPVELDLMRQGRASVTMWHDQGPYKFKPLYARPQPAAQVPDGWRDVLQRARDSIGAGTYAEHSATERSYVAPYLDGIFDELAELEQAASPQPAVCQHRGGCTSRRDHVVCKSCGWVMTDSGWGIASRRWFASLAHALFYQQTGRLPDNLKSEGGA